MKSKLSVILICATLLVSIGIIYNQTKASSGDPGTISDPLVTKSYVDQLNAELKKDVQSMVGQGGTGTAQPTNMTEIYKYIDNKFAALSSSGGSTQSGGYVVVIAEPGKKVIGESSTEMILRDGEAKVISNKTGDGIPDVTMGADIKENVKIEKNHLLIIPRTDGRGLAIVKRSVIMVKGGYTVK